MLIDLLHAMKLHRAERLEAEPAIQIDRLEVGLTDVQPGDSADVPLIGDDAAEDGGPKSLSGAVAVAAGAADLVPWSRATGDKQGRKLVQGLGSVVQRRGKGATAAG